MSVVVAVLLGCTALAAAVGARIAFRLARTTGSTPAMAWGSAGATAVATIANVCTIAGTLDLGHGQPTGGRIAISVVTLAVALGLAYLAYDVTGPSIPATGGTPAPGLSRPKRFASAAATFTGTFVILALILPLLK
ncbi:hypothetical protein [Streptomyces sp. NPDC089919]|uniref:hypothetical protein n=1 Tax=Streptomyces sp. NPDC089919 TaxID=3155188 RepID=UPI003423618D